MGCSRFFKEKNQGQIIGCQPRKVADPGVRKVARAYCRRYTQGARDRMESVSQADAEEWRPPGTEGGIAPASPRRRGRGGVRVSKELKNAGIVTVSVIEGDLYFPGVF